jgi:hypothetical protein
MEIRGDRICPQHRGIGGQVGVHTTDPGCTRAHGFRVEMNDLRDSVHTGVGPAGGNHAHGVPGDFADGLFQRVLHAATRRLRLKAAEREARIFDRERNSHNRE